MIFSHIVAASQNDVIGVDGDLPWHLKDDFKRFKRLTTGHIILMGRKTFESIGKPLVNRHHVVLTTQKDWSYSGPGQDNIHVSHSIGEALQYCAMMAPQWESEIFCIGGAQIYKKTIEHCRKIYLTRVHKKVHGDAFYSKALLDGFSEVSKSENIDAKSGIKFDYIDYERI